jgi:hypothetical protein
MVCKRQGKIEGDSRIRKESHVLSAHVVVFKKLHGKLVLLVIYY